MWIKVVFQLHGDNGSAGTVKNLRLRSELLHALHGKGAMCRNFNCVHQGTYLAMSMWTFFLYMKNGIVNQTKPGISLNVG